jgi:GntR family transcriptional regulator
MNSPRKPGRGRPKHSSGAALRGARRLDRRSKVPLHYQLGEILKELLEAGAFEPGALFASERELEERFGVSRSVVRQALGLLVADGEIHRRRGAGTFVTEPKRALPVCGLVEALLDPPEPDLTVSILEVAEHAADAKMAELLEVGDPPSELIQVTAVLHLGEPLCLIDSYVSVRRLPWWPTVVAAVAAGREVPPHPAVRLGEGTVSVEVSSLGRWTTSLLGAGVGGGALVLRLVQEGTPAGSRRARPVELARLIYRGDQARPSIRRVAPAQTSMARTTNSAKARR